MIEFNATFIIAMLSFVVFIIIMNAIFYRPILNIIRKREDYVEQNYSDAKDISKQADDCNNKHQTELAKTKEENIKKSAIIIEQEQKKSFEKTQNFKEQINSEIQSKKDDISQNKINLQNEVNSKVVGDIAALISSRILKGKI